MNLKQSALAAAVTAVFAIGAAAPAAAAEYAVSRLFIDNLTIAVLDGEVPSVTTSIKSFNFNLTNTATLNSVLIGSVAACGGTPGIPSGTTNTCGIATALDATVVNATGSTGPAQGENTFTLHTPNATDSYANSDSLIQTAELTGDASTQTKQIAEAQIQAGDLNASSSAEISSTTGFLFKFTVSGTSDDSLFFSFDALLDILADINDPTAATALSKANVGVELSLSKDNTIIKAIFLPNGTGFGSTTDCGVTGGGLTCQTLADEFDINSDVQVSTLPVSTSGRSNTVANDHFSAIISGLSDGDWTLGLVATTSTSLSRTEPQRVPEPGVLALMGLGLMGLFATSRRRKLG